MSRRQAKRREARRFGQMAEWLCLWRLRLSGYQILVQNYRQPVGEVDIIARHGSLIAFIEVKARQSVDQAAEAIVAKQKQRIERAATAYLATASLPENHQIRFDAMLVQPWRPIVWIRDAWRPDW